MDTASPAAETPVERSTANRRSFAFYRSMTFVSLIVGYVGYYLCRANLSPSKPLLTASFGLTEDQYGAVVSLGTVVYAVGKLISGPWSDIFGGRRIFLIGLAGAALSTLAFGATGGLIALFVTWALNRAFQSVGWGGLMSVLPRWFSATDYGTASGGLSISYQLGGVVATALCGLLIHWHFGWRALFLIPALLLGLLGLVLRNTIIGSPRDVGYELPAQSHQEIAAEGDEDVTYVNRLLSLMAQPAFVVLCGMSLVLTFVRECFNAWMPDYFAKTGSAIDAAAFKSTLFPLLGIIGTLLAGWISDRFLQGRRGPVLVVCLVGACLCLIGLAYPERLTTSLEGVGVASGVTIASLVGLTGFFILPPYSMVGGGVFALDYGGRQSAGTAAGLLDGVGYIGATLAGYGIAKLVQKAGWTPAFASMAGATLLCALLSVWLTLRQRRGTK
jgi:sugar phosphate permease